MSQKQSGQSGEYFGPSPDLVNVQQKIATLDQLLANYDQMYKTYLQEVESEVNKKQQRKYPYTIKNASAFENVIVPKISFPYNGTEETCFKSCINTDKCRYALYSNSGCGIDCNPNKCLLYGANAGGIAPVAEAPSAVPPCPASSGETTAWCKNFNDPAANAIIPVMVLRKGNADWRTLAGQLPKKTVKPEDAPFAVDLTTNVQTWSPDSQFSVVDGNNQISLQFRYFAEYWLNAYGLQSGSTPVIAGQGPIGTYSFSRLTEDGKIMYGPWIQRDVPVQNTRMIDNNVVVYMIENDNHTKMVSSDGQERYYKGKMSEFNPSNWTGYNTTGGGKYILKNAGTTVATPIPNDTQNMQRYRGAPGIYSVTVKGTTSGGTVWGTDTYTDDSDIRVAAVHAGVVKNGETKSVQIQTLPGQASYAGSSRNSVSTSSYGSWNSSYKFVTTNTGESYVGAFGGQTMFWNSNQPSSGGAAAGTQTAAFLASNVASKKFKYNYSAFENPVWDVEPNTNAMMGQIPPQLAQISIPSWKFLGLQDSTTACQTAAANDPDYVFTTATYFNASYSNPKNGNNAFARSCYGNVAGAPSSTAGSASDDNVQTMTPPYGYTKLGGKNGIVLLKKMYQLNKQIMALTDDLKLSTPKAPGSVKEGFSGTRTSDADTPLTVLAKNLDADKATIIKIISENNYADTDLIQSDRLLLHSRIKFGIGIVLGILMGYLAYRFFTSGSDVPKAIQAEISAAGAAAAAGLGMEGTGDGGDGGDGGGDIDNGSNA